MNTIRAWSCPFYTWSERLGVHCEGGRLRFPDKDAADEYANRYCAENSGWKNCTVARALLRYYERTEEK